MTHTDPVCGMTIDEQDAAGSYEHNGTTYYFCHPSCLERFQAAPEEFLGPERRTTEVAAEYTCPMHPEIVTAAPGPCPICGMSLEPRAISLADRPNPELIDMTRRF